MWYTQQAEHHSAVTGNPELGSGASCHLLFRTLLNPISSSLHDTGFFYSNNPAVLAPLFASLSGGSLQIVFELDDIDPGDNFFDFKQGVDGGLVNVGTPPIVTPPTGAIPEPATVFVWTGLGLIAGCIGLRQRKRNQQG